MHLIAYISDFDNTSGSIHATLADIVSVARRENGVRGISGVLFYVRGKFLQVIEGEEAFLRQLMKNIEADSRHKNIEYLIDTRVEGKGFQEWNMDSFVLDEDYVFDATSLRALTASFEKNLIPRSDTLVLYYKTLLRQKVRA